MDDLSSAFAEESADDNEPVEAPVFHRDREPYTDADGNPAVFFVLGEYSDALRKLERKQTNKSLRSGGMVDAGDLQKRQIERWATAITGWRIAIKGEAVPFSHENVVKVLTAAPWIGPRDLEPVIQGHASFFAVKS